MAAVFLPASSVPPGLSRLGSAVESKASLAVAPVVRLGVEMVVHSVAGRFAVEPVSAREPFVPAVVLPAVREPFPPAAALPAKQLVVPFPPAPSYFVW